MSSLGLSLLVKLGLALTGLLKRRFFVDELSLKFLCLAATFERQMKNKVKLWWDAMIWPIVAIVVAYSRMLNANARTQVDTGSSAAIIRRVCDDQ